MDVKQSDVPKSIETESFLKCLKSSSRISRRYLFHDGKDYYLPSIKTFCKFFVKTANPLNKRPKSIDIFRTIVILYRNFAVDQIMFK